MIVNVLKRRFINPLLEFFSDSRAIGLVLLACTIISLFVTNYIPGGLNYQAFWNFEVHFFEVLHLPHTVLHWINDGFMSVFFALVGMEIKRELINGELSTFKKSLLPISGAVGGMVVPAIIFLLFTKGTIFNGGWGIPTATDIAFSLGIASLAGKRVPVGIKIFLTALAIIDDLGAIVVIALFYGGALKMAYIAACIVIIGVIYFINKVNLKFGIVHLIWGALLWYCMFNSGIHATVAGVIIAFMVPTHLLTAYENKLHHPVYFFIMPVFAIANTAILFPAEGFNILSGPMPWGIMLGLFIGKPLGIVLACLFVVKRKWAELPREANWYKLTGAGILAGIGFTMGIFIATLAFHDKTHQDIAKIAILTSSFASMIAGYIWLHFAKKNVSKNNENYV